MELKPGHACCPDWALQRVCDDPVPLHDVGTQHVCCVAHRFIPYQRETVDSHPSPVRDVRAPLAVSQRSTITYENIYFQKVTTLLEARPPLTGGGRRWYDWAGTAPSRVRARLEKLGDGAERLMHLDYHVLNVLVEQGQVSAVIDWASARGGDLRGDVARTVSMLRLDMGRPGLRAAWLLGPLWRVFEAGWRRGVLAGRGRDG